MSLLLHVYFLLSFYGYYLTLIFLAVKTISEIFEVFEKIQLVLTKKETERLDHVQASIFNLLLIWFLHLPRRFQISTFTLVTRPFFTLSFVKMRCFF